MLPKELLNDLEKGDRTMEMLKIEATPPPLTGLGFIGTDRASLLQQAWGQQVQFLNTQRSIGGLQW